MKIEYLKDSRRMMKYLAFFLVVTVSQAQSKREGSVFSSEDGEGLPGATVTIKGTLTGTVTDYEGNFSLVAKNSDTLNISFVGYISKQVVVGNSTTINVQLAPDVAALDEVVVIGYGTQKKSDITGSVASIRKEDMNPGPVVSVSNLMQSTAPGVVLTQSSSQPGGGFDVKIRGASSVLGANGPLYVIDGMPITSDDIQPESSSRHRYAPPRNPLNGINPQDIVSIEILKDASATAIYGARGANGVVLITTKRGGGQKFKLDYSSTFSLQHLNREYDMLNASEYAQVSNEVFLFKNPDDDPIYSAAQIRNAGDGTNWIDQVTRLGTIQQHQVGGSGGYKNLNYYVSANYFQHRGIVDISELERLGGRANIDYKNKRVNTGFSVSFTQTKDRQVPFGANSNAAEFGGLFDNTRNWSPMLPVRDENGDFTVHPVRSLIPNPVSLLHIDDRIATNRILGTAFFEYEIATGLKAKINLGRDQSRSEREALVPTSVIRGEQANGEGEFGATDNWSSLGEFTMNYNKQIGDRSRLTILGGTTFQQFDSEGNTSLFVNFADQTTDFSKITNADTLSVVRFKERSRLLSYLGRVNYAHQDRFLFTFTFRADGSTKFGPNNKWGYFPSAAMAWKIHNENFFRSSFIEELKLRGSYGQIGNQEIGNKRSQSLYNLTRRTVIGGQPVQGLAALRPDNPDLKWETTTQLNLGLDFAVLNSRIYGSVDVYEKTTTDVLLDFQLPGTAGFDAVTVNAGAISNRGVELALTSRNIVKTFQWTSSLNVSYNKNQWKDRAGFYPEGQQIAEENGPLGGIYGYQVTGLFQSQDEIDNSLDQSAVAVASPGTFKYADTNGDGVITPEDRVLLGQYDPKYTFGLNNSFTYKGFDLNFFFQGALGKKKMNFTRAYLEDVDDIAEGFNKSRAVMNRWTPENPTATVPGSDNILGGFANNDQYIEDASFVRLRNITLGYSIGDLKMISNLRIYADVQNLITITPFQGNDPETDEFVQYPNAKTYTIGLNATF